MLRLERKLKLTKEVIVERLLPLFMGGFFSGIPVSIGMLLFLDAKHAATVVTWTVFCAFAILILK